jgi:lactate dehydrogenase-like 2-hydroxyacid dehydrogenase
MTIDRQKVVVASAALERLVPSLSQRYHVIRGWIAQEPSVYLDAQAMVVAGDVPLDMPLLEMMPALRLVACATRGYDAIDLRLLKRDRIDFTHADGVNDQDVADHALGNIIVHRRALLEGDGNVRSDAWRRSGPIGSRSLEGARVGIVGLGRFGHALAKRASALRMAVRWWAPTIRPAPWPRSPDLLQLAKWSEYLVVAARLHENRGLISRSVIAELGPRGYLVSVSRGQLVDEDALVDALRNGRLGGAALDVFEQEPTPPERWMDVPNVFLTPHMSGKTVEAFNAMSEQVSLTLAKFFAADSPMVCERRAADRMKAAGRDR